MLITGEGCLSRHHDDFKYKGALTKGRQREWERYKTIGLMTKSNYRSARAFYSFSRERERMTVNFCFFSLSLTLFIES